MFYILVDLSPTINIVKSTPPLRYSVCMRVCVRARVWRGRVRPCVQMVFFFLKKRNVLERRSGTHLKEHNLRRKKANIKKNK